MLITIILTLKLLLIIIRIAQIKHVNNENRKKSK